MAIDPSFKLTRERTVTSGETYQLGQDVTLGGNAGKIVSSGPRVEMLPGGSSRIIGVPPRDYSIGENATESVPHYSAAVRIRSQELRWRKYFDPSDQKGIDGEEHAIEARGQIAIPIPRRLKPHECDALGEHQHCSDRGVNGHGNSAHGGDVACCMVLEKFPVSVHFAVPLRDPIIPGLGDNLIVTIERRPYVGDVPYAHEPEE